MHLPMLEVQVQSLDQEDALEEEMAPFGIVAWRIPWTEEPGSDVPTNLGESPRELRGN